ncbi:transposable element Tcb1 transposase [Trichonephila clavipes]|nr:transposable element Tcb1 transposase [Trichonephila clavipes]
MPLLRIDLPLSKLCSIVIHHPDIACAIDCKSSKNKHKPSKTRAMTILRLRKPLRRNRRQYEQLTDFDRGRIIGLREAGWSNRRIGRHLGRSDMVVARCWQQWITEGKECTVAEVSTGFCRPRATWCVTDWRRVIFSDESRFILSADDHRTRVWRRTGQRSDPAFIVERHTAISQGVTVWGAKWDTRSSLVVLQGTLTARRYVDDILTPIVLPMLSSRPGAIYQQDNVRPHTARLSQQCLQGYDVLPWPARSPDFANRACLERAGKATAAVPRYRRINVAQMQRLWQDLPQGVII